MLLREIERELEKWDIWRDPFRELNRMNLELFGRFRPDSSEFPPVNMWRNEEKVVISTELPGIDPAGVDLNMTGKTLTIKFQRKPEELKEGEVYTRKERWYGEFSRTIELPFSIDLDRVEAKYRKGVLHIELQRAEDEKPRKITVSSE
ncbi:MAG: Hsp20/alpha crystallin family protein [Nitrospirae bacterium]|nr:Hsp20/alpha crystallin family protein [Nitrospirota bacterium]